MTDIPTISFRELIKMVKKIGFEPVRQKGSHIRFQHPDGRKTTIPDHGKQDVNVFRFFLFRAPCSVLRATCIVLSYRLFVPRLSMGDT